MVKSDSAPKLRANPARLRSFGAQSGREHLAKDA
jgi:hypothetical protein